jgi:hypothetical protein
MLKPDWRYFTWGPLVVLLEIFVRLLATYDYSVRHHNPYCWAMVDSTKSRLDTPSRPTPEINRQ